MGLVIKTDVKPVKVIRKDGTNRNGKPYTLYSIMCPFKVKEEWNNVFIDCAFKKDVSVANKAKIEIKDCFMTGSIYNGNTKPKLFITDFTVVEEGKAPQTVDSDGFMNVVEGISEELPFM
jgi:hypothetical protein